MLDYCAGIGHSTGKKLLTLGITTLSELLEAPFAMLKDEFGYQIASTMQKLCQGHDESMVIQSGPPQVLISFLNLTNMFGFNF